MLELVKRYHPITGDPFRQDETYRELPPCKALAPYIRCFWGTPRPITPKPETLIHDEPGLVIPDTCMDIIFDINYSRNSHAAAFCTLDEHSYRTGGEVPGTDTTATFAIRFYAWTACLFADWDFTGRKNAAFDPREMFRSLVDALEPHLYAEPTLAGKAAIAQALLLQRITDATPNPDLMNAVHHMLLTDGRARINDLCSHTAVSARKLERLFQSHMGIAPKSFASLVRYQLLWQELALGGHRPVLDLVERFGYTDQAHLLNDFRSRHLMTPAAALRYAGLGKP